MTRAAAFGAALGAAFALLTAACSPMTGYTEPAGMTPEIQAYSDCIGRAARKNWHTGYGETEDAQLIAARCRNMESRTGAGYGPNTPANETCSNQYYLWHTARHGRENTLAAHRFAETVCAGRLDTG